MTVAVVGSGPAADAVETALADTEADVERVETTRIGPANRLAVVVDQAGAATFEHASDRARDAGIPWFAVELGGVGGYPLVDAAVASFDPEGACYRCLSARVGSNAQADAEPTSPPADATARFAGAVAGREVATFLDPASPDHLGTVVELPYTRREFLPVPGCDCGGDRDRVLDGNAVDRPLDRSLERAERALDDRVGIVAEVGEAESYPAPYYLAQLCDTSGFADAAAPRQAAGVDAGWDAAFMKALGEGLERYCAGVYHGEEFRRTAATDLADAVPPSAFVRPEEWIDAAGGTDAAGDNPDGRDDAERPWVRGENVLTGDPASLPAELVHYPPPERTIKPSVTTGLGLGNATVEALLSGLYEVIERDASTIAWYSSYDPLELVVEDPTFEQLAARAGADDLDVTALLLTQDVDIPVVGVAVRREEYPKLALGTAAHLDPERAARSALAEAVQNFVELREMGPEDAETVDGAIGPYARDPAPVESFVDPDQQVPAAAVGPDDVPSGGRHLRAVADRVEAADLDVFAARTTTRDVQKLGFEAVRVLVPEAQPLFFDDPFFGERARTVPEQLGFEADLDREHHPYP
jgi:ribosomal protein S12 methylthiotransferase accessory factor